MAFVFSSEGPAEELGAAKELAETPEAMEMSVVLWHEARCTGAEDFDGAVEDFGGGAEDFGGAGAARGICHDGFKDSGREGIEEEALDL